jgi:hypothetical protein
MDSCVQTFQERAVKHDSGEVLSVCARIFIGKLHYAVYVYKYLSYQRAGSKPLYARSAAPESNPPGGFFLRGQRRRAARRVRSHFSIFPKRGENHQQTPEASQKMA